MNILLLSPSAHLKNKLPQQQNQTISNYPYPYLKGGSESLKLKYKKAIKRQVVLQDLGTRS